jgi:hypothetical protein
MRRCGSTIAQKAIFGKKSWVGAVDLIPDDLREGGLLRADDRGIAETDDELT